jgi:pimeloyl-[acyl-carrier protein] synthase
MTLTDHPLLDLAAAEMLVDPYPTYARLRADGRIAYRSTTPPHEAFIVLSRFADVQLALRDPRFGRRNFADLARSGLGDGPLSRSLVRWMVFRDPPDHTRLRGLVSKAFTPKAVERLSDVIHDLVERLLEPLAERAGFDLIAEFAYPLPVLVICELLGASPAERTRFRAWSAALAKGLDSPGLLSARDLELANAAAAAMTTYFHDLLRRRRAAPAADLLSALAAAEQDGDRLTEDELLANCVLLFFAGHETTVNLIGNGVLALLRHPDQLELLRDRPLLAAQAVEELLRFDSPVQRTGRVALADVELADGQVIRAGEAVSLLIGSANRDPRPFEEPERLRLARPEAHRHLAFAAGIHYCVGAPLARLEAQIAIACLLRRLPGLRLLDETPEWRPTLSLRGLRALLVTNGGPA